MRDETKPTHNLVIVSKANKHHKTLAGKAWENDFDGFAIKLNPGVVINAELLEDNWLNLNLIRSEEEWNALKSARNKNHKRSRFEDKIDPETGEVLEEDDIRF